MIYENIFAPTGQPLPKFEDGDEVLGGNFAQEFTGKPILIDGGRKVLFVSCNLTNCVTTIPAVDSNTYCGPLPTDEPPTEEEKDAAFQAEVRQAALETYGVESEKCMTMEAAICAALRPVEAKPIEEIKP